MTVSPSPVARLVVGEIVFSLLRMDGDAFRLKRRLGDPLLRARVEVLAPWVDGKTSLPKVGLPGRVATDVFSRVLGGTVDVASSEAQRTADALPASVVN